MSAAIKKMLAERAARARATAGHSNWFGEGVAAIRAAAPRLDAGFDSKTKWKPSEVLLIGYCILATSARPEGADELLREGLAG